MPNGITLAPSSGGLQTCVWPSCTRSGPTASLLAFLQVASGSTHSRSAWAVPTFLAAVAVLLLLDPPSAVCALPAPTLPLRMPRWWWSFTGEGEAVAMYGVPGRLSRSAEVDSLSKQKKERIASEGRASQCAWGGGSVWHAGVHRVEITRVTKTASL